MPSTQPPKPSPSTIATDLPEFDRVMRGLIKVPKAQVDAAMKKGKKRKASKSKQ